MFKTMWHWDSSTVLIVNIGEFGSWSLPVVSTTVVTAYSHWQADDIARHGIIEFNGSESQTHTMVRILKIDA
jgi:hypothetical protein